MPSKITNPALDTTKDVPVAILTLDRPGTWDKRGRKRIAAWMRQQADHLEAEGKQYTLGRHRARYLVKR